MCFGYPRHTRDEGWDGACNCPYGPFVESGNDPNALSHSWRYECVPNIRVSESMSQTRRQISRHVHANAGIHFNELVRVSALAPGQVQYHIRQLLDQDELVRNEFYGRTHYYPPTYGEWERAALALLRRETTREIVVYLIEGEPASPAEIAAELEIVRSTLEYHLDRLVERELVEKYYDERNHVTLELANAERIGRLLSEVEPTVPDRLLDRFTRLVDELLEGSMESTN